MTRFMGTVFSLSIIFLLHTGLCQATVSDLPTMDRSLIRRSIAELEKDVVRVLEITVTGEILEAGENRITLLTSEGVKKEYLMDHADVYLNGLPSDSRCLHPISPEKYFQGRLYLDARERVRVLEAWYIGGEAQVVTVESTGAHDAESRFFLTIISLDTGKTGRFKVSSRLDGIIKELKPGTCFFYLLNIDEEINYILASD